MRWNESALLTAGLIALLSACEDGPSDVRHDGTVGASSIDALETLAWKVEVGTSKPPLRPDHLRVLVGDELVVVAESDGAQGAKTKLPAKPTTRVEVDGDAVYFAAKKTVYAANLQDGKQLWKYEASDRVTVRPIPAGNRVFVTAGSLAALEAETGRELWKLDGEQPFTTPASLASGVVYVGDADGKLFAVDAGTGQRKWDHQADAAFVDVPLAVTTDLVVGSTVSGTVFAVFRDTGREKWRFPTGDVVSSGLAAEADLVFVGTEAGAVFAINARNGQRRWAKESFSAIVTPVLIASGKLHFGTETGVFHALDTETGEPRWKFEMEAEPVGAPLIGNGEVFFADTRGHLYRVE